MPSNLECAAHEPPGDVSRLQLGAFGEWGSEIAGDGDEDMRD
jgi:hypothetical protein